MDLVKASALAPFVHAGAWNFASVRGQFVELLGDAPLTICAGLIGEAQRARVLTAWIGMRHALFNPSDAALSGVALRSLLVVRLQEKRELCRAADVLIRTGAYGLVVIDPASDLDIPLPDQSQLVGLAHNHKTAIMLVSGQQPRTSLASLRAQTGKRRIDHDRFEVSVSITRSKRGQAGHYTEVCHGCDFMC
jgi:recombination protein RecA